MSPQQADNIHVIVARIDERVIADRKSHAVYSQHINDTLSDIKILLKVHIADDETMRVQLSEVVKKVTDIDKTTTTNMATYIDQRDDIKDDIDGVGNKLDKHIKKDRPIGRLTDNKNAGLILLSLIIGWTFIDKIALVFEMIKLKYFGV